MRGTVHVQYMYFPDDITVTAQADPGTVHFEVVLVKFHWIVRGCLTQWDF